jgi:hypothetical protein
VSQPENPYLPPQQPAAAGPVPVMGGRPKWFLFAVVSIMVLAALGVLGGLWAVLSYFLTRNDPFWLAQPEPGMAEYQRRISEVSMPGVQAALGVVNAGVCTWALVAGARLMKPTPGSRQPFAIVAAALAVYEVVALAFGLVVGWRAYAILEEMFAATISSGRGMPADTEKIMMVTLKATMVAGLVFALIWGGCKIALCLWARAYVQKPAVEGYVDGPAVDRPQPSTWT